MSLGNLGNLDEAKQLEFDPSLSNYLADTVTVSEAILALDGALKTGLEQQDEAIEIVYDPSSSTLTAITTQGALDQVAGRLDNTEQNTTTNTTDISNLDTRLTTAETNITNNDTDISNLDSRLLTAETNITNNDTDISNLDTRVTTAELDIVNLESKYAIVNLNSASDVKSAYESNANTNEFSDSLLSKLNGIEAGAEVNPTASEVKTLYESNADTNAFTDAEKTNLANQSGTNTGDQVALTVAFTSSTDIVATNTRDAIEEVKALAITAPPAVQVTYDNTSSGLTANNVQTAIDEISADQSSTSAYLRSLQIAYRIDPTTDFTSVGGEECTEPINGTTVNSNENQWYDMPLNNILLNQLGGTLITSSANAQTGGVFSLPAGTYSINGHARMFNGSLVTIFFRLIDAGVGDTVDLRLSGESARSAEYFRADFGDNRRFTLTQTTNLKLQISFLFENSSADNLYYGFRINDLSASILPSLENLIYAEINRYDQADSMETQQVKFEQTDQYYFGSSDTSAGTETQDPKSLFRIDSNFKLVLPPGKHFITVHHPYVANQTAPEGYVNFALYPTVGDPAFSPTINDITTNAILRSSNLFDWGTYSASIIVEPSVTTTYTVWVMPGQNANVRWYIADQFTNQNDPDKIAVLSSVRLSAPSVGDAGAITYAGGTNVQEELDDHETRITQNETDISTQQGLFGQTATNRTYIGGATPLAIDNTLWLPGSANALTTISPTGSDDRVMLYNQNTGRLFPMTRGIAGTVLQDVGAGFLAFQNVNALFVDYSNATSGLTATNTQDAIDRIANPVITTQSGTFAPTEANDVYVCDTSAGTVNINLPAISTLSRAKKWVFKDNGNAGTNNITINRSGTDLIDGQTSVTIATNYSSVTVLSDTSSNYWLI